MNDPLDFTGKRVLVTGGSSGIGNGIAQGFRASGAEVHVTGTRPDEGDYLEAEDSDLTGLTYHCLNAMDRSATTDLPDTMLEPHVLVQSQGIVRYGREEFGRKGWDDVVDGGLTLS